MQHTVYISKRTAFDCLSLAWWHGSQRREKRLPVKSAAGSPKVHQAHHKCFSWRAETAQLKVLLEVMYHAAAAAAAAALALALAMPGGDTVALVRVLH